MSVSKIGNYAIDGVLGSGAAGTAYRAHDERTGDPAAVKLLSEEMSKDETMQRRFVREMEVLEKLSHPNIVRYFDGGLHDDRFYYAMELVEFGTLKDVLQRRGRLSWQEALECGVQICSALERAHQDGIVHRDLKPLNLFLSEEGLIKLGDFGLARDVSGPTLTQEGTTVGTCLYMAPEQIQGLKVNHASDIYALGCLLYEMLVGRVPYVGDNVIAVLDQHLEAEPPSATALVPDVPLEFSALIQQMLAKDPGDRPIDADAVRTELLKIQAASDVETDVASQSEGPAPNLTHRLTTGPGVEQRTVSWKALAVIAVLLVVAIVAATALK